MKDDFGKGVGYQQVYPHMTPEELPQGWVVASDVDGAGEAAEIGKAIRAGSVRGAYVRSWGSAGRGRVIVERGQADAWLARPRKRGAKKVGQLRIVELPPGAMPNPGYSKDVVAFADLVDENVLTSARLTEAIEAGRIRAMRIYGDVGFVYYHVGDIVDEKQRLEAEREKAAAKQQPDRSETEPAYNDESLLAAIYKQNQGLARMLDSTADKADGFFFESLRGTIADSIRNELQAAVVPLMTAMAREIRDEIQKASVFAPANGDKKAWKRLASSIDRLEYTYRIFGEHIDQPAQLMILERLQEISAKLNGGAN